MNGEPGFSYSYVDMTNSKGAKEFQNLKNMGGVRLRKTDVKSWSFESWRRGQLQ